MSPRRATTEDLPAIVRLLDGAGLPTSDLTAGSLEHFLVWGDAREVTHCIGLERYGDVGLVRSLVVAPIRRGCGDGSRLLVALEGHARRRGVASLYLLTTTAAPFFASHGYRPTQRERAPTSMRASEEFTALCPASATCMTKSLQDDAT